MSLSTNNYKGTRDFYPEDMRLRKWMFNKWREVLESFGYEEYDGPILESMDLFTAKTSEEIVNEQSFNFEDRGGRRVIMRPEMTPTVSRMVAKRRQELGYPLRLYSIPNCFRYERQQRGRLREFWQLNADLFGVDGVEADIEIIMLANSIMESFRTKKWDKDAYSVLYKIKYSSRALVEEFNNTANLNYEKRKEALQNADRKLKIPADEFKRKIEEIYVGTNLDAFDFYAASSLEEIGKILPESRVLKNLRNFEIKLKSAGIDIQFDACITRGFDYYTDIVFEVFDFNDDNNRSMFGGGRYDGLVGEFGVEPVPTVGFGMGDVTFQNFLETNGLLPDLKTETELYVIPVGDAISQCQELAQKLRVNGVNVAVDISGKKLDKQIKTADKKGIQNVLFVGNDELNSGKFKLKNLNSGDEQIASIDKIVEILDNN